MKKPLNSRFECTHKIGWQYLRIERFTIDLDGTKNAFYAIKIWIFKLVITAAINIYQKDEWVTNNKKQSIWAARYYNIINKVKKYNQY